MAKASKPIAKSKGQPEMFKGGSESLSSWVNLSVVQRWADERMPVSKQGRFVTSSPEQLNVWLGRESGKPVHVITRGRPNLRVEARFCVLSCREEVFCQKESCAPDSRRRCFFLCS